MDYAPTHYVKIKLYCMLSNDWFFRVIENANFIPLAFLYVFIYPF
ncbi:hypothetical protein SAMN02787081_03507 [Lysinibacillus fusiformis]|uniref:Uncharacterized protein n=1 Tax=Lysinibacillus fusiformis TaxID=28031 RepID=A0A1H9N0U4_9BACI|nr:hypothetical protein SAMN02787081_03507 [Lysinibacillus fusiformis]SEO04560.1 hypothetical protein SAMN02787103_03310 [Lysinibacillus fusiformis]SER29441.1 hypothetical protein SAMN02787113_03452 [Lysinibacillus fusiformis]